MQQIFMAPQKELKLPTINGFICIKALQAETFFFEYLTQGGKTHRVECSSMRGWTFSFP